MKNRTKALFLISIIAVIAFYLINALFTLGTIFTPASALKTINVNPDRKQTVNNSFVTVDLSLSKPKKDKPEEKETTSVDKIYVFVGEVRSFEVNDEGNELFEIRFQFKTKSSNDGTAIRREVIAKIPVRELSGGYSWIKVFDAKLQDVNGISYERVKISTPDSIDLYEVVFTDDSDYVLQTSATFGTETQIEEAGLVIDEQNMFTVSNAKKFYFTDGELKTIASVNSLKDGQNQIGEAPLSTVLYLISTSIFGMNTFGLRFFDSLAGLGLVLLACAFAIKVFGKEKYGIMAMLFTLFLGATFTAGNFATSSIGAFFAVLSIYLASRYFVKHYYFEDRKSAIACLICVGLSYGIAFACDMAYALILIGLIVLFTMSRKRAYKQFKKLEKEAKGLDKEDVYLNYHKNNITSIGMIALALLVIPMVIFTGSYAICSATYKAYYGAGFVASAFKHFAVSLTPAYESSPLALFVGFGGLKFDVIHTYLNVVSISEAVSYCSFLNYFTSIFALASFIFVTVAVFFGKKIEIFKNVGVLTNKYKIVTVAFLTMALPVFLGLTSSPYGFAGVSVFACAYIAFAKSILVKCVKGKTVNIAFNVALIISFILFAMAFVGFVGLNLSQTASKILYFWQVL